MIIRYYRGLDVYGEVLGRGLLSCDGDAYVEQMKVCSPDGVDITDMLTDDALLECENVLLEEV